MTDAPEKVHMGISPSENHYGMVYHRPMQWGVKSSVEYIRADLVDQWQPIETAPTTTPVLVWDEYWLMRIGYLKLDGYWVTDSPCFEDIETILNPTHWKKLPKPPKT